MARQILTKQTKDYIKRVEDAATLIEVEWKEKLPKVILQTNPDEIRQLPYITLTRGETHILVKALTPIPFYTLFNFLIEQHSPIPQDIKGFAQCCAKLVARKHLMLSFQEIERPKEITYTGTLAVSNDGTITFMPDDENYNMLVNIPLVTVYTNIKNPAAYRPIVIKGQAITLKHQARG